MAPVTSALKKPGGVQICRRSLLVVLRPLWNFCTIFFLSWSKLLDSLLANGVLGACMFVCFGHRALGMCTGYDVGGSGVASCSVQKNIAAEKLCLGLFWKEPSWILAWGEAVRVRVMTSCTIGNEAAGKPVSQARKSAELKLSRSYIIPTAAPVRLPSLQLQQEFTVPS